MFIAGNSYEVEMLTYFG